MGNLTPGPSPSRWRGVTHVKCCSIPQRSQQSEVAPPLHRNGEGAGGEVPSPLWYNLSMNSDLPAAVPPVEEEIDRRARAGDAGITLGGGGIAPPARPAQRGAAPLRGAPGGARHRARRLPDEGRDGHGHLRRQGAIAARPRALVLRLAALDDRQDARTRAPDRRLRGHPHRHAARGADPRKRTDQALPAALQHPPQGRQDLPVPEDHQ